MHHVPLRQAQHGFEQSLEILKAQGEDAWHIGEIQAASAGEEQVEII